RIAEIRAEPAPLPSADRAPMAAFMACGMASPRPRPNTANQAAANPVPLLTTVVAPTASAAAMIVNPTVTSAFALTIRSRTPSGARRRRGQPGAADHAGDHAADHGQQPQPAAHGVHAADLLEVQRHREEDAEHRERHQRRQYGAPGEAGRPEQPELDQRPDR